MNYKIYEIIKVLNCFIFAVFIGIAGYEFAFSDYNTTNTWA